MSFSIHNQDNPHKKAIAQNLSENEKKTLQLKALESENVKGFFDSKILKPIQEQIKYEIENAKINGTSIKLSERELYVKTPIEGSTTCKIQKLYFQSYQTFSAARKRVQRKFNPDRFEHKANLLQLEFDTLVALKVHVIAEVTKPELMKAFQDSPYGFIRNDKTAYYEGPLYAGDVFDLVLRSSLTFTPSTILRAFNSLIAGVAFLQEKSFIHVDIKLENILYEREEDGNYRFRLADFGSVVLYEDRSQLKPARAFTYTKDYIPASELPLLNQPEDQLHALSSFLLGEVLFRTFLHELPFGENNVTKFLNLDHSRLYLLERSNYPDSSKQFIKTLLDKTPANRPTKSALYEAWQEAKVGMPEIIFTP